MATHSLISAALYLSVPVGLTLGAAWKDFKTREINDIIPISIFAWAVIATIFHWSPLKWSEFGMGILAGVAIGLAMHVLAKFADGDAMLLAAIGPLVGWNGYIIVFILFGLAGGVIAVIQLVRGRKTLPYVPAIAAGIVGYAGLYFYNMLTTHHH